MRLRPLACTGLAGALLFGAALSGCRPTRPGPTTTTTTTTTDPNAPTTTTPPGGSYAKGPNPTAATAAAAGTFAVQTAQVTGQSGFGGGNLYYPTDNNQGTFGGIVLAPPFTVQSSANASTARRLATHGFVVLAFDANSASDFPSARAAQGRRALTYLTEQSSVRTRVDPNRLAFGGFSMGGGATMEVANSMPTLKAAMPMVPWNSIKSFPNVRVPTLILAAENDSVASVSGHSVPFYTSIPAGTPKTLAVAAGASHGMPSSLPSFMSRYAVSWMKVYVDNDARYKPFTTVRDGGLSDFRQASVS